MSEEPRRPRRGLDTSVPNAARMHDYLLGGKDNFAADREAAEAVLAIAPEVRAMAAETHAFQGRVLRYLLAEGMRQFLVLGVGLPSRHDSYDEVRAADPDARLVYAARDAVVLSHARALLAGHPGTAVVEGDVLHPAELMADHELRRVLDPARPVAVLVPGALNFIPEEDEPVKRIAELRDMLPAGSHLVLVHALFDVRPEVFAPILEIYKRTFKHTESARRTREQVLRFFDGWELIEPGLVWVRQWRPDSPWAVRHPEQVWMAGAVGRKRD
ncbi:hypothetical protein Sru01_08670 [Sphaerisporangium rufum]|uniref:S-adenosyl methyltransferase n=1 Tax=Sphaerisporangium rufum TaxID=1381558 RepID=A0A919V329_9ACTN|nr:SAM-dependent methyltransferase [Sphaerisporangium rufum]GII75885.1 hypothetical protein Sru01_08670 [Sphaerisporangium rufum]